ncbi:MAG: hypothetical protein ACUZ8H_13175 [Candidatus Anammoxibacter sp.]
MDKVEFKQLFIKEYLKVSPTVSPEYLNNVWDFFWAWAEETGHVSTPQEYAQWDSHQWNLIPNGKNPVKIERRRLDTNNKTL